MGGFCLYGPNYIIKNSKKQNCFCIVSTVDISKQIEDIFINKTKISRQDFKALNDQKMGRVLSDHDIGGERFIEYNLVPNTNNEKKKEYKSSYSDSVKPFNSFSSIYTTTL